MTMPRELFSEPAPGLLLMPEGSSDAIDSKYSLPFHFACPVYVAEYGPGKAPGSSIKSYRQRFLVHAPDRENAPLARRVGRMLLLLHTLFRRHMGRDHPYNGQIVEVWLTQQKGAGVAGDAGGEQFKNQIYLFALTAERTSLEWAREISHEYGHYILPGISGFSAPEEWANGMLGERLFLSWLNLHLRSGSLKPEAIPFVTPRDLQIYVERQVTPLLRRIARDGLDTRMLTRKDAAGMDYFTGLALYIDSVYGSKALDTAFAYTTASARGFSTAADFGKGATASLQSAVEFTVRAPLADAVGRPTSFMIYLPVGEFQISAEEGTLRWEFPAAAKGVHPQGKSGLRVNLADWQRLTIREERPGQNVGQPAPELALRLSGLRFFRVGTEPGQ